MQITQRYILQIYEVQREVYGLRQFLAVYGRWTREREKDEREKKFRREKERDGGGRARK